jgi:putative oxidoreductase
MKKLLSTKYSAGAFNTAMLLLRLVVGFLMINHGYDKLVHFGDYQTKFMNFLGMGQTVSLALVVFAEFFCSIFLILGLFTRLSAIPLIVVMCVALFSCIVSWMLFGALNSWAWQDQCGWNVWKIKDCSGFQP